MPLSNIFSNKLNYLDNSLDNKDIISRCQKRNTISPWLLATGRNRIVGYFKIKKGVAKRNRIANYSKIK